METFVPFSTQDSVPLWDRNSSTSGFPFVSYLARQWKEAGFFLTQFPDHDIQMA